MGTMLSRRSFVRLGMATGGALLLAACGQAPSPTPTSPQPPTIPATSTTPTAPAAKPTPAPTGKIEITFSITVPFLVSGGVGDDTPGRFSAGDDASGTRQGCRLACGWPSRRAGRGAAAVRGR